MKKKQLFLWSLYDFANSIVFINFLLYFSQWLVIDGGLSDFWYNAIFAIATLLLLLSAPSLATLTDKHGGRKFFLNISTTGTFIFYGLSALLAWSSPSNVFVITLCFLLGQYFYQLSFIFFNPMLSDIADESHRGRASGIRQFSNALGQLFGLVMTFAFSESRLIPALLSVPAFFILALPMMIYFKEDKLREKLIGIQTIKTETKTFIKKFTAFFAVSAATPLLLSFFFFNDALVTISNNYSIYMERVFAVPDSTKSLLLMAVVVMSGIGGFIAGWVGDRIGNLRTLKYILILWAIALPIIAIVPNIISLGIVSVVVGLLLGSVWTVSSAYLSTLLSKEEMGYGFSFYTLAERFATLLGPLTWGGIILFLGTKAASYRIAMAIMAIFVIIGLIILHYWKRPIILNNEK